MDRYFNSIEQKTDHEFANLGRVVCIVGPPGIGKTWALHQTIGRFIELTSEILRSKKETVEFLERIRASDLPIVLDEYECVHDLVGLRELNGPPSAGQFFIISHFVPKIDFDFETYIFPPKTFDELKDLFPTASDDAILESKGDIRWIIQSINFKSDFKDEFSGPREFVTELLSTHTNTNPVDYIGHPITEPGNVSSILQQNYVDAVRGKVRAEIVTEYLSVADILDARIYAGDWSLLPFFNFFGCILPAKEIGHVLNPPLKPGSTWTKYQNICMRTKKIHAMATRVPQRKLTIDELLLIRDYAEAGDTSLMKEYRFTSQDLDTLNHLSPLRKIKAKTLASLKKCLT